MRAPLVGRATELSALRAVMDRSARRPGPVTALVTGPPGSGKTRLLAEALAGAPARTVLRVVGYEPEETVPLAAARDLMRALSDRAGDEDWIAPPFAVGGDPRTSDPLRLFEAAYRSLRRVAPLVLLVDDLQWIDQLSLALLSYLVRAAEVDRVPMALLAAGRPGPNAATLRASLRHVLADDARAAELELEPLGEEAGVALVRSLAPHMPPDQAADIWAAAAGSPFWITALTIEGHAVGGDLARRLNELSADAAASLRALTVIGRPSEPAEVAELLDWSAARVAGAARELANRGLAAERAGHLEVAHDLIRETAERQLPPDVARRLHARFATQLRRSAEGDVGRLSEALDHALRAGGPPLGIALELAAAPQRRLLGTEGLAQLAAIARTADESDAERQTLELRLAELASELGDRTLELERWSVVAGRHPDVATRGRGLLAASKAAYRIGLREDAGQLIARARELDIGDEAFRVAVDAQEAHVLRWLDFRLAEARELTARAMARGRALVERHGGGSAAPAAYLDALQAAYDLAMQDGNDRERIRLATEMADAATGEVARMETQLLLSSAYRASGSVENGERIARAVRQLASDRVYPAIAVEAGYHLAHALYGLGRLDEADAVAAEADALSNRISVTGRFLSTVRALRPMIAVGRGNWRSALARMRQAISEETDPHYRLGLQQEIATWLSRLDGEGAGEEIRRRLAAADVDAREVGCRRCMQELALKTAEALARIGDIEGGTHALRGHLSARERHNRDARIFARHALGVLKRAHGQRGRAAAILARVSAEMTRSGRRREALWADLDLAEAVGETDRQRAIALYRAVADRAAEWGAATEVGVARQRLRALGLRTAVARPAAAGMMGLTPRELEVARLVAAGATNPEIARTLFLSRKTVERHVSGALSKIGARNRTELVARLAAVSDGERPQSKMRDLPDTGPRRPRR